MWPARAARPRRGRLEHLLAPPRTEPLCLHVPRGRQHRASDQAVTGGRIEIRGPRAETIQVQPAALGGGDEVGRGARLFDAGELDAPRGAERCGDPSTARAQRGRRRWKSSRPGLRREDRRHLIRDPARCSCRRAGRANRIARIRSLQRVVDLRQIRDRTGERTDVIEARQREMPRLARVARRSASGPRRRRRTTARESDPLVSVPSATGTRPAATAAAEPARRTAGRAGQITRIAGRAVVRVLRHEVVGELAHVERADAEPRRRPGASRPRWRRRVAGGASRWILDPAVVTVPARSNRFFTAYGTPASGPGSRPAAMAASTAVASRQCSVVVTAVKALSARACG